MKTPSAEAQTLVARIYKHLSLGRHYEAEAAAEEALRAAHDRSGAQELRRRLEACLAFEKEKAGYAGFSDCTCMSHSRDAERAYENGECPHQQARKALAATGGEGESDYFKGAWEQPDWPEHD